MEKLNIEEAKNNYIKTKDYDQAVKILFKKQKEETKLDYDNILVSKALLLFKKLDSLNEEEKEKYKKIITILLINYILKKKFKLFHINNYIELDKDLEKLLNYNDNSEIENLQNKLIISEYQNTTKEFYLNQKSYLRLRYNRNNKNIPKCVRITNYSHEAVEKLIKYLNDEEDKKNLSKESLELYHELYD